MRFKLVEDLNQYLIGSIVFLKQGVPYKNEIMEYLVDTNHQFFVLSETDNTVFILATTTNLKRAEKSPSDYVKVSGSKKEFLVELNSWGTLNKDYVQRVSEIVSADSYADIAEKFYNSNEKLDTLLEKQKL